MEGKKSKKTKEKVPDIRHEFGYLIIDGKYYKSKMVRGKTIFEEVSTVTVKKSLKLVDEIVDKLKDSLDKEAVLRESLMRYANDKDGNEMLRDIHNALYNVKRKVKPKTREHHCVDMKIGNIILPIVD